MQTPALFKPMNLGEGFGEFDDYNFDFDVAEPTFYDPFAPDPFGVNVSVNNFPYVPSIFDTPVDLPVDYGLDLSLPENIATVDNSGNVDDQNGNRVISADAITRIAKNNPGREGEAIAKTLVDTAPQYTKQFKSYDDLVKAAYNLFNTSKAVIQGKPIPQSIRSPYVYNPNDPNMVKRTTTAMPAISTNMLLIGGVALAAFLVLRKK